MKIPLLVLLLPLIATACPAGDGRGRTDVAEQAEIDVPACRFVTEATRHQDAWPCFSPDGKSLLFSRSEDGRTWNLYRASVGGGIAHPFPEGSPASGTRANWSTIGNVIAFNGAEADGAFNLSLIDGDGSNLRVLQVAGISGRMSYPSWYPDGKRLAVVEFGDDGGSAVKRIDMEQGAVEMLTNPQTHWAGVPRVSPDGARIVMGGQERQGQAYNQYHNQIWMLVEGGEMRRFDSERGWAPCWSPDGRWIAFASDRHNDAGQSAVFAATADGATIRRVTARDLNAGHPTWSPDGRQIAFYAHDPAHPQSRGLAIIAVPPELGGADP